MSLLKSNSVQIGQSETAENNFTLSVPSSPDGTIKLARGNSGATTADILTVDASGNVTTTLANGIVTPAKLSQPMTLMTGVAASTASVVYTGIPSWAKRITIMFYEISITGANHILVRLGTPSGFEQTGYKSQMTILNAGSSTAGSTIGFIMHWPEPNSFSNGTMTISHMGSNVWTSSGTYQWTGSSNSTIVSGGSKVLTTGVLDRVQILSGNGSDTFDSGSVNVMYEG
jgi:hypothetical protein